MYAYAHTPLDEEIIKHTSFSSGDKLLAFIPRFYGLKGLSVFFTKQMSSFFKTHFDQNLAFVQKLSEHYKSISNLSMTFYMKIPHGTGLQNTNFYSTNCSLLIHPILSLQYPIQNTHLSLLLMLP